jgi:catechol 2,3-dioxygenase-like lactoylglutathione lyase family enzyme
MVTRTSYSPDRRNTVSEDTIAAGLGALTLFVEDLQEVTAFYREVLRLEEIYEDDESTVFDLGGTVLNVLAVTAAPELVTPAQAAAISDRPCMLLTLSVDDVDAVCEVLRERGIVLLNGPIDRPWGKRTAAFADPAGTAWELAQDIP